MLSLTRRHPLISFFALAFGLTWAVEIPMYVLDLHLLQLVLGWMPALAALLVTAVLSGRPGTRALLAQMLIWRVRPAWYVLALFGIAPLWFGAQLVDPLFGGRHLPLFFVPGSQRDAGFPVFLAGTVGLSIVFTWMFNNSGGSVLLCTMLHQSINSLTDFTGPGIRAADQVIVQWLFNGMYVLVAIVLIACLGSASANRAPRFVVAPLRRTAPLRP